MPPDARSASVVIRTRNEADRLRLTLTALGCQTHPAEIVVVDDGSDDHTAEVIRSALRDMPLRLVTHTAARGGAAASNAGAEAASGDIVIFLDGDVLAGRRMVEQHLALHWRHARVIGRGETWHLRCTRYLQDPESGRAQPAFSEQVAALSEAERSALTVTRAQIRDDFDAIERRAQPGIYPGHGPRRLHALEMDGLRHHPDCPVLWAAASGHNLSLDRASFRRAGGFDERLNSSEHRELALRLCRDGACMKAVEDARTFHMTHRIGWRDPLVEQDWFHVMYATHTIPAVRLLPVLWAGLSDSGAAEIGSLPELAARAAEETARSAPEDPS